MQILNTKTSSATEITNQCLKAASAIVADSDPGLHRELDRYTALSGMLQAEISQLCILRDDLIQQLEDLEDDR